MKLTKLFTPLIIASALAGYAEESTAQTTVQEIDIPTSCENMDQLPAVSNCLKIIADIYVEEVSLHVDTFAPEGRPIALFRTMDASNNSVNCQTFNDIARNELFLFAIRGPDDYGPPNRPVEGEVKDLVKTLFESLGQCYNDYAEIYDEYDELAVEAEKTRAIARVTSAIALKFQ